MEGGCQGCSPYIFLPFFGKNTTKCTENKNTFVVSFASPGEILIRFLNLNLNFCSTNNSYTQEDLVALFLFLMHCAG